MSLKFARATERRDDKNHRFGLYKCSICGRVKEMRNDSAKKSNSCGCESGRKPTHGMSFTKTYRAWSHAKDRCHCKTNKLFSEYGGRGITMCERWLNSFENFFEDMRGAPNGMTLERKDTNSGYSKENCIWATHSEQMRNRRDSYVWVVKGVVFQTSLEAEKYFSVSRTTITRWVIGRKRNGKFYEPFENCYRRKKYNHEFN